MTPIKGESKTNETEEQKTDFGQAVNKRNKHGKKRKMLKRDILPHLPLCDQLMD